MKRNDYSMKKIMLGMLLTLLLVFMTACGATNNDGNKTSPAPTNSSEAATNSPTPSDTATVYPLTITDDTGTEMTFEKAPTKIVSIVPSETELVYAIGAGENVVGVDTNSNYPEEAAAVSKVGDMTTDIEAVIALNPDIVVASSSMNVDAITRLRELKITVFATDPTTYDAVVTKVETFGKLLDKQAEAAVVADRMRDVKKQVTEAVKDVEKKSVYLEFSPGWTVGSGTFLDELITLAGGENIASATPSWFEVNGEEVIKQNPQLIIYPILKEDPNPILVGIQSRPGWEVIDAMKNKQLYAVSDDQLSRVGPRLADGLLELAKVIHPDLIK